MRTAIGSKLPPSAAALLLVALAFPGAHAAEPLPDPEQLDENLKKVERALDEGSARKRDLDKLADSVEQELQRLRQALVLAAEATQQREAELTAVETKLADLQAEREKSAASLAGKKLQLTRVSGALRRLAARPPLAMIASPADPLDTVHTAMLLGSVVPDLQSEAARLSGEIARHAAVEREIRGEQERLAAAGAALAGERARVAALLEAKQAARSSMAKERSAVAERLSELAASARDLRELMQRVEQHRAESDSARKRLNSIVGADQPSNESAVAPGSVPAPSSATVPGTTEFVARLPEGPDIARNKGNLTYPAAGRISQRFGAPNALGLTERGIVISPREQAQVVAPFDGKVVYAGPFRGYGQIVMIEHGGGYLTLMAGMSSVDVQVGQGVLAGEPVARMGPAGTGADGTDGLYVEFRHNGAPINPLPWWSARTNKVRR
ncbi:peptidoglycan DD-metalloendopeptidase family protein [Nisaea acidiphila]|uniref:Peptidoglycan DD-metalloendopeptidase family protein n=1 Tax=Nisaea acidiphila TaxID=1862145 RepID=A0A9J7AM95_9PROT|nr:peptidoglycan DD-metalloendopeptidase family protein [Nisaea acidiphila]UUX48082.1 peptidoglycan DD-metalloendopeptidase family protein [Nisaea acidiphila]